jgi:DNA-directed RNA polymerase alpha subunit
MFCSVNQQTLVDNGKIALKIDDSNDSQMAIIEDIRDLGLSVRAYNCLKRSGVNTVSELCEKRIEFFKKCNNLGRISAGEIGTTLDKLGLKHHVWDSSWATRCRKISD